MKDVEGTLVHETRGVRVAAALSPPDTMTRIVDAVRRPTRRLANVAVPYGVATACFVANGAITSGPLDFVVGAVGVAALGRSLWSAGSALRQQLREGDSLTYRLASRIPVGQDVAMAAARMIEADWSRATIRTSQLLMEHHQGSIGKERRLTIYSLPSGASIAIAYRNGRRPLVMIDQKDRGLLDSIKPQDSIGPVGSAIVLRTIERIQADRLSNLLGVPAGQMLSTLSHLLADALPAESDDEHTKRREMPFLRLDYVDIEHVIETRHIKSAEIVVTSVRDKYDSAHLAVLVEAPGMGTLSLPPEPFSAIMRVRRDAGLKHAFGIGAPEIMTLPVFQGNARATRIADLARQVLQEDPDLLDSSGAPLRKLIVEHMPRLLATHRDNTATARTSDIAEIDGALDRGLDIVARELGEALDRIADRKLDDLRTELRFLESRHPGQDVQLSSIPAMAA